MRIQTIGRFKRITIDPGEYVASGEAVTISTLLGSCVAACLFDPINRIIGMNHFMLSSRSYARSIPIHQSEAGRYGIHAMELLINEMLKLGAQRQYLRAKAFGGSSNMPHTGHGDGFACVGSVNCTFIREFLKDEQIPLISHNLGGEKGRVVHFSNGDFAVYLRKIERRKNERLAERDHNCWLKAIEQQEHTIPAPDIWL